MDMHNYVQGFRFGLVILHPSQARCLAWDRQPETCARFRPFKPLARSEHASVRVPDAGELYRARAISRIPRPKQTRPKMTDFAPHSPPVRQASVHRDLRRLHRAGKQIILAHEIVTVEARDDAIELLAEGPQLIGRVRG